MYFLHTSKYVASVLNNCDSGRKVIGNSEKRTVASLFRLAQCACY